MKLRKTGILIGAGIVILSAGLVFHLAIRKPTKTDSKVNSVSDKSLGIFFNMSRNFEAIPKDELIKLNPGFTYGFRPANDPNAQCIVSQSQLTKGGNPPTPEEARDGILGGVKTVHPDAVLVNTQTALKPAKFGQAEGLLLEIVYSQGSLKIRRAEVIALGNENKVIAFCESLDSDNSRYYEDFKIFFSSLELNS